RGLRRGEARNRADELISQFDMAHAADRQVSSYSGGMRRRIDIAVSLVVQPKVLFLDEPTTGLDPRSRRDVWNLVSSMKAQGITVLLTTQYLEEADILSDSIVILNAGQIVASGTADELKRQTGASYCEMTPLNPDDLPRIATVLSDFGEIEVDTDATTVSVPAPRGVATLTEVFRRMDEIDVELIDISLRRPSLDEVFLHLTTPVTSK
ncbi:ATP-binding cassette domain-containing protein, partial [Mycolicibacterium sp. CBMA 361]